MIRDPHRLRPSQARSEVLERLQYARLEIDGLERGLRRLGLEREEIGGRSLGAMQDARMRD